MLTLVVAGCGAEPRATGPLPQDVYVWQLQWSPAVQDALVAVEQATGAPLILATEIRVRDCDVDPRLVEYDGAFLKGRKVGVVVRLGPLRLDRCPESSRLRVIEVVRAARDRARRHGAAVTEVQLDYDSPTRSLRHYARLLSDLRLALGSERMTITALPTWLDSEAFEQVALQVDAYVLQVHSLERPRLATSGSAAVLFDPTAAHAAVNRAGRLGHPFHVSLPTYGYELGFDAADGVFLGLKGDAPAPPWPTGASVRVVRVDPEVVGQFAAELRRDRPAQLQRLRWFRLPIGHERLNWDLATFTAVLSGSALGRDLRVEVTRSPQTPTRVDITLYNAGTRWSLPPARVAVGTDVVAPGTKALLAEGLAGYEARRSDDGGWRFGAAAPELMRPLAVGERRRVGWIVTSGSALPRGVRRSSPKAVTNQLAGGGACAGAAVCGPRQLGMRRSVQGATGLGLAAVGSTTPWRPFPDTTRTNVRSE